MTDTETTPSETPDAKRRPTYEAKKVDSLPEDVTLPRSGPRPSPQFIAAAQAALDDPGELYELGTWYSENGAKNQLKRIQKGDVKLPGEGDWQCETRRMWAPNSGPDSAKPERWSKLYAKYIG